MLDLQLNIVSLGILFSLSYSSYFYLVLVLGSGVLLLLLPGFLFVGYDYEN